MVTPRDAYFAARYIDAEGHVTFSFDEADIADPNADIVIWALFYLRTETNPKSQVEGYYDPKTDAFKTMGWSRKGEPLYKAAIQTIKHFAEKLCAGPAEVAHTAKFTKLTLPLIRKVYPKLIADKMVGIEPLRQPSSLIYYTKFRYSKCSKNSAPWS
jgi:hypothetical protein